MRVASLTTFAPRAAHIRPSLDSVCAQDGIDRVLLLVAACDRDQAGKTARDTRAELHVVADIGPGRKHLAAGLCEPDDIIVTFDDDHEYEPQHARTLTRWVESSDSVCGFVGHRLNGDTIDHGFAAFLSGAQGWAYRAGWLSVADVLAWGRRPDCWHSDDIYLGAIFRRSGRRVMVVPGSERNIAPRVNPGAWFVPESLRFAADRIERSATCQRIAWADLMAG